MLKEEKYFFLKPQKALRDRSLSRIYSKQEMGEKYSGGQLECSNCVDPMQSYPEYQIFCHYKFTFYLREKDTSTSAN